MQSRDRSKYPPQASEQHHRSEYKLRDIGASHTAIDLNAMRLSIVFSLSTDTLSFTLSLGWSVLGKTSGRGLNDASNSCSEHGTQCIEEPRRNDEHRK